MSFVVHGATGAQGGPLRARLIAAGQDVHDTRGAAEPRRFDNASVASLVSAYRGAHGVFIHLPMAPEPVRVQYARNIAAAVEEARPRRVVVSTSGTIVDQPGTPPQTPADSAIATLVRGIESSGVSHAIIAPRLYLENLLLPQVFDPMKAEGKLRYPIPVDFPVSWSSHLDVAEVAERLLIDDAVTGIVGVGHLPGLKGSDLAEGFAVQLGRPVAFEALTPEQFGDLLRPMFGPGADAVVALYRTLSKMPGNVIDERTSAQHLLGLTPRTARQWLVDATA